MMVQSRRVDALSEAHLVLVRFGGRAGTLICPRSKEVLDYQKECHGLGQNLYGALFFEDDADERHLRSAISKDIGDLLETNSGPLGISAPRLQRMMNAREWSRK